MSPKAARPSRPAVVKIGGSLVERGAFDAVLGVLAGAERPVVVVPGGGAFAETVRVEQARLGFSDEAAHVMALLAMAQTAHVLASLMPRLCVAETREDIGSALDRHDIPVWAPYAMADVDPTLPRDWSTTSDALAAWLAIRLESPIVVLAKSVVVGPDRSAADLAEAGIVDPVFARIVTTRNLPFVIVGPGEEPRLEDLLAAQPATGGAPQARTQAWPSVSSS